MNLPLSLSDFLIRRAIVPDVEAVCRHRSQMWLEMNDLHPNHYDSMYRQSLDYFREAIPAGTYVGWVLVPLRASGTAVPGTAVPGTVAGGGGLLFRTIPPFPDSNGGVCPSDKQAHILNVFIEKEYRGLGLAKYLMETMLDWCRQEEVGSVTLNASSAGKPLYEQLNFTEVQNFMKWNSDH